MFVKYMSFYLSWVSKVPYSIAWPSKSPDLNLKKQLWDYIKNKVRWTFFKTADELFERLSNKWDAIPSVVKLGGYSYYVCSAHHKTASVTQQTTYSYNETNF